MLPNMQDEFDTYGRDRAWPYLKKLGVDPDVILWARDVEILKSWTNYTPTRDAGFPALALPVYDTGNTMVDIIAWEPTKPEVWYSRTGKGHMLGLHDLNAAIVFRAPLKISATPLDYLKNGLAGCCPLTETAYGMFQGVIEIEASLEMYNKIILELEKHYPRPKLMVQT